MTGLLLLFVAVVWLAIVVLISVFSTRTLPMATWRVPVALVIFAVLLPLPLIDEIVGGRQFEQLCKEYSTIQVDRLAARGRTVYLVSPPDVEIKGTWVRIVLHPYQYVDASTKQIVVSYNSAVAAGGRFIRMLGISEGGMPLTFSGTCRLTESPKNLFKSLDIKAIAPPK